MNRLRGFTLIELMVTLAAGIILLAVGIPAFTTMMANNQSAAYANDLVMALNLARSEAVKRKVPVAVCASNAVNTACDQDNWENGWLLFTDVNTNGSHALADDGPLLRVWGAPGGTMTVLAAPDFVRFTVNGELDNANDLSINTELAHCTGQQGRAFRVTVTGYVSVARAACN
ncbi:MAG: GspH/FimT family pseudopilin [gamma proteobacterium endosymbiont of Lamellibrachia anaximandri]|nr:GspH/FimT family pseudopilin [gamma proteobacterium endosymbiont of Lamellibrachia anaximandri]